MGNYGHCFCPLDIGWMGAGNRKDKRRNIHTRCLQSAAQQRHLCCGQKCHRNLLQDGEEMPSAPMTLTSAQLLVCRAETPLLLEPFGEHLTAGAANWRPWGSQGLAHIGGSDGKESACHAGDLGSIPRLGRSPGGGHGNPLQFSCLGMPHEQRRLSGYSEPQFMGSQRIGYN